MEKKPAIKTAEEILNLKNQWMRDPIWDIEDTEGFEAHWPELLAFRRSAEKQFEDKEYSRLFKRAEKIGIFSNIELMKYLESMEHKIEQLEKKIEHQEYGD